MSIDTWFIYLLAILILTASPGPSILLCVSASLSSGLNSARWAALGSVTAIFMILTLSFTGLGVIIASSDLAFTTIKWVGAAYLVYLGIRTLLSAEASYQLNLKMESEHDKTNHCLSHYASGFIVGASNPKAIIFFTALFPQFIDPSAHLFFQYLLFSSTFIILELGWLLFYSYLAQKSSGWLIEKGRATLFNRLTGTTFICAGVLLSTSKRISS